jgi:hypothetical protein
LKIPAIIALLSAALLTGCAGSPSAAPAATVTHTVTATPTPTPSKTAAKATPTPVPVKTSGNYGTDLAAAGVVPDSVSRYAAFMEEELCNAPLTTRRPFDYTEFSNSVRTLASTALDDIAAVRVSVAYFCPERKALAEEALHYHGYIK